MTRRLTISALFVLGLFIVASISQPVAAKYVQYSGMWLKLGWQAVDLTPNKDGLKIGASTYWTSVHPNWKSLSYAYQVCK